MRVLYLTNAPSPYRVEFFEELGKYCDLDVYYELSPSEIKHRDISWYKNTFDNFTSHTLKKTKIGKKYICFDVINILKNKYDVIIIGVYSTPTAILAINYLYWHKKSFFINSDGGFINPLESKFVLNLKKISLERHQLFWLLVKKQVIILSIMVEVSRHIYILFQLIIDTNYLKA